MVPMDRRILIEDLLLMELDLVEDMPCSVDRMVVTNTMEEEEEEGSLR